MSKRQSVQDSKAKLRARAGEPQLIGLVDSAPKGAPLATASRASKRGDPFAPAKKAARKRART